MTIKLKEPTLSDVGTWIALRKKHGITFQTLDEALIDCLETFHSAVGKLRAGGHIVEVT